MTTKNPIGYEYDSAGRPRGRDPREMTVAELTALGHERMSPMEALRARCLDCCAGQINEVRLCVSLNCPAWPFRMGSNPWIERTPEQIASLRERGKALAARGKAVSRLPSDAADPSGVPEPTPEDADGEMAGRPTGQKEPA